MEGHIVFNYYNGLFSTLTLYTGYLLSFIFFCFYCNKAKIDVKKIFFLLFVVLLLGSICGSVGYKIFYKDDIKGFMDFSPCLFQVFNIGFFRDNTIGFIDNSLNSNHCVILGIIFGCSIFSFVTKKKLFKVLDCCIIPICFFIFTYRIMNLFHIENIGLPTEKPWGVVFSNIDYIPRHATMLYEAVYILFVILTLVYLSSKCSPLNRNNEITYKHGFLFFLGIFLIYFFNFFIEMIKVTENLLTNSILDYLHMSINQLLSICLFLPALIFVVYLFPSENNIAD